MIGWDGLDCDGMGRAWGGMAPQVAVGTPKGLVVPVLRGVDRMSFAQVEKAIGVLGKKARSLNPKP